MTRFYRDRLSFGRIYWILMGLLALSLLLFALLEVLIEGCPSQVGFLKTPLRVSGLLLEAVALAALMMILLRFRFLPFVSALPVLAGGSVLSVLLTRTYQTSAAYRPSAWPASFCCMGSASSLSVCLRGGTGSPC